MMVIIWYRQSRKQLSESEFGENGEDGNLLTTGYANIFYVCVEGKVSAVSVRWHSGIRKWRVYAGPLFGRRWHDGYRAFSSATADTQKLCV
jgi:hypothetical protein